MQLGEPSWALLFDTVSKSSDDQHTSKLRRLSAGRALEGLGREVQRHERREGEIQEPRRYAVVLHKSKPSKFTPSRRNQVQIRARLKIFRYLNLQCGPFQRDADGNSLNV